MWSGSLGAGIGAGDYRERRTREEKSKDKETHKGERKVSSPARWSLWTWLRKHAKGESSTGLRRKKSTVDNHVRVSQAKQTYIDGRDI